MWNKNTIRVDRDKDRAIGEILVLNLLVSVFFHRNDTYSCNIAPFYAPVICNHCPHLPPTGRVGDSWAKVQGNYFSSVLSAGEMTGF